MSKFTNSIIDGNGAIITPESYIICAMAAILCGILISCLHAYKNRSNIALHGMLAFLPIVIMTIIMVVNQNIGTGLAIAGAFALIRFRSIPGNARTIGSIFCSVTAGVLCGMGFIFYSGLFTLIVCVFELFIFMVLGNLFINNIRYLKITIPENLDYDHLFDEIFIKYLKSNELIRIKTVNMGSLFELTYAISSKTPNIPKDFIDRLRIINRNLNITISNECPEWTL